MTKTGKNFGCYYNYYYITPTVALNVMKAVLPETTSKSSHSVALVLVVVW